MHNRSDFSRKFFHFGRWREGWYPYLQTYSFSHQFSTKFHMKRFHTKFHQQLIINPDFRILVFKVQTLFYQLPDQISTFFFEMFVGNDIIFHLKKNILRKKNWFWKKIGEFWQPKSVNLIRINELRWYHYFCFAVNIECFEILLIHSAEQFSTIFSS